MGREMWGLMAECWLQTNTPKDNALSDALQKGAQYHALTDRYKAKIEPDPPKPSDQNGATLRRTYREGVLGVREVPMPHTKAPIPVEDHVFADPGTPV